MYKAIIEKIDKTKDGLIDTMEVTFTDGVNPVTKTVAYTDYMFKEADDVLNFLTQECDALDKGYEIVDVVESLIGKDTLVEDFRIAQAMKHSTIIP